MSFIYSLAQHGTKHTFVRKISVVAWCAAMDCGARYSIMLPAPRASRGGGAPAEHTNQPHAPALQQRPLLRGAARRSDSRSLWRGRRAPGRRPVQVVLQPLALVQPARQPRLARAAPVQQAGGLQLRPLEVRLFAQSVEVPLRAKVAPLATAQRMRAFSQRQPRRHTKRHLSHGAAP